MNGKGSKIRKGANLQAYWNNYPFPEKLTVTQWKSKLGFGDDIDMKMYDDITGKITEEQFLLRVKYKKEEEEMITAIDKARASGTATILEFTITPPKPMDSIELTEEDIEQLKNDMNSMSFSEFKKITKK